MEQLAKNEFRQLQYAGGRWYENHCVQTAKQCPGVDINWLYTDEMHLPQWFKDLPFDDTEMEATVVDQKIDNLLGVLDWDLAAATNTENTFTSLFSFE